MKIAEIMTRDVQVIAPDASLAEAAKLMDDLNVGALPVCDGKRLLGVITDRDITVRATAAGVAPDELDVSEVMTETVEYCRAEDHSEEVLARMSDLQIRRMPVVDDDKQLVGIVALGDFATEDAAGTQDALSAISEPSQPDR
jgi:CBS domain-containing protein